MKRKIKNLRRRLARIKRKRIKRRKIKGAGRAVKFRMRARSLLINNPAKLQSIMTKPTNKQSNNNQNRLKNKKMFRKQSKLLKT